MALSVEIKYDAKFFDTLNKELKSDVPRTLRFFGALFERRSKAEARKHTHGGRFWACLLYTSPSPRDGLLSRMPSSA